MNSRFLSVVRQLKQRKIVQWSLAYLAAAWVVLQVLDVLKDQFLWGLVFQRSITAMLVVGFLAMLVFAWYHGEKGRQKSSGMELLMLATLLVLAGAAITVVRRTTPTEPATAFVPSAEAATVPGLAERTSIAVLPFANLSDDKSLTYFSDGFTEELINRLANVPGLRVASRSSSFALRDDANPVAEAGRRLGVATVLEGSIRKSGNHVRVTAQLINAGNGFHMWSETYERQISGGNLFGLEDEVTREISEALNLRFENKSAGRPPSTNPAAYDAYLRGLFFYRQSVLSDSAMRYFQLAIERDPGFAVAHGALARVYDERNFAMGHDSAKYREMAFVQIEKALALDPDLAEAYTARGSLNWTLQNGFPHVASAQDYRRAVQLNPNSAEAHEQLGGLYGHIGLHEKSMAHMLAALRLDPYNVQASRRLARALSYEGRYQEALEELNKGSGARRNYDLPIILWKLGRTEEAKQVIQEQLRESVEAFEKTGKLSLDAPPGYDYVSVHAMLLAQEGNHAEAERQIATAIRWGSGQSHFHHSAFHIACAYAMMDRPVDALRWLRRAAREGFPNYPVFTREAALKKLERNADFRAFMAEQKKLFEYHQSVL